MQRFLKISLLMILVLLGLVFVVLGILCWRETHSTIPTVLDTVSGTREPGTFHLDDGNALVDTNFIVKKAGAAVMFLFGVFVSGWAVSLMFKKEDCDSAA
jgi:hypothetical protein